MLATLFPHVHRRYEVSRYAADLEAFATWLCAVGYSHDPACDHVFRLKQTLERIEGSLGARFTEAQLREVFTVARGQLLYRATQQVFIRFLKHTGRFIAVPPSDRFAALRADYRRYLAELRGFAGSTIAQHDATVSDFLVRGFLGKEGLQDLRYEDIERYVQRRSQEVTRQTLQHIVAHLRAFLRHCHAQEAFPSPLHVIDTPRTYRGELPPRALDWRLVVKLLASVDRQDRCGWRDYAVLHLMAFYGLRPSEISALEVDAIDWVAKTLRVAQRKTRSLLILPLADRTMNVLKRYLRYGRPVSAHPQLFLRARCPAGALTHYGVVDIFRTRARRSGLPLEDASSYGLRHGFAMRLLRRGVGVKAIGDLLGHRSLESTCVYLRLDIDMLRAVALPVPRPARRSRRQP